MKFNMEWQWLITFAAIGLRFVSAAPGIVSQTEVNWDKTILEEITQITQEFNNWILRLSPGITVYNKQLT